MKRPKTHIAKMCCCNGTKSRLQVALMKLSTWTWKVTSVSCCSEGCNQSGKGWTWSNLHNACATCGHQSYAVSQVPGVRKRKKWDTTKSMSLQIKLSASKMENAEGACASEIHKKERITGWEKNREGQKKVTGRKRHQRKTKYCRKAQTKSQSSPIICLFFAWFGP